MKTRILICLALAASFGAVRADSPNVRNLNQTYARVAAVTPSDSADLAIKADALYVGVSGDVKVMPLNSATAVTFKAAPVGILSVRVKRVYSTGTTATNILQLMN